MAPDIWAVPLQLSNFNVAVALLGGFMLLYGLVSFLVKERLYLSETRRPAAAAATRVRADASPSVLSLLVGAALGPLGARLVRPGDYAACAGGGGSEAACRASVDAATLGFSRLVLGVQLVIVGVQLPGRYLAAEARPLLLLLGPGMTAMWLATSVVVWLVVGAPSFLHALAVGACVAPTDPVLSAVIVKGRFADQNVLPALQHLIVAESGANDGLGYPFLFLALYLVKFLGAGVTSGGLADAVGLWLVLTWVYVVLGALYGAAVGLLARELLRWAERRAYVDRESFLAFSIALALFVVGTAGLLGTDDVLACFVAGNTFTWDDWFRVRTKDDSLQPTVDMLLNVALWYGASLPWAAFAGNAVPLLTPGRLALVGLLVLVLRRLPWVLAMHKWIRQVR